MTKGWEPGCAYTNGDVVEYCDNFYRIIQAHTSQGDWTPDRTPALWGKIPECDEHKYRDQHKQQKQQQQCGGYGQQQNNNQQQQQQPAYQQQPPNNNNQQQQGYGGQNNSGGYGSITQNPPQNALKIGGGILGTAAAIGIGAFAFDKYKDSKEEKEEIAWGATNWETDARRRQGEYLEAIKANKSLPPVQWVLTDGANIPQGAISGGQDRDGTPLYIARAYYDKAVHVGKISKNMSDGCRIAVDGKERVVNKYEILLGYENAVRWVDCSGELRDDGLRLVEGGREEDNRPIYIAQAHLKSSVVPGKCGKHLRGAYVAFDGDEENERSYRVLTYAN
ncbi:hypothetical protein DFS34DRAFT_580754 [Phlyctochytrium arcticum]|nr:hypothetical protein DFS34DRAFT_580754 [Phlyctochytrium arcticum]